MNYVFLPIAFFENNFVLFQNANLSIATHALHYGTSAFGGLRGIINPENQNQCLLFRIDKHTKRLSQSATFLDYEIKPEYIENIIKEFIIQNKPQKDVYIRPLVYTADLGIAPRIHHLDKNFLVYGLELGDYLSPEGVSVCFSSWVRQQDHSLPLRGKISGAYITSSLAKSESVNRGFDEAIMMNSAGKVSEASSMNIFIVRNGQIITPGVDQDILEGITRASVIEVAKNLGYEVLERQVDKTELLIADEVFLTGTAARITPIYKIESTTLPESKPITNHLRNVFKDITLGKDPNYENWINRINF